MPTIEFGQRSEANEYRDKLGDYLSAGDDRRTKTVDLKPSTPDNIVDRLESVSFASIEEQGGGAGMAELTGDEKEYLKDKTSFNWQDDGFAAMRAKASLQKRGATDWLDFYEPGEQAGGAVQNLRRSKQSAAQKGTNIGVKGDRTDAEEVTGRRRRRRQVERGMARDTDRAKQPAFGGDAEAISFLQEEQIFSGDVFDIDLRSSGGPRGRDYERLQDAHESRSERAQRVDERRSAKVTRDPLKWAANKGRVDFPGIDTVDPEAIHESRSERAREADEREFAPIADNRQQWATAPDRYDWRGVDTPAEWGATMNAPIPTPELEMSAMNAEASESIGGLEIEDDFLRPMPRGPDDTGLPFRKADIDDETERERGMFESVLDDMTGGQQTDELEDAYGGFSDDRDRQGSLAGFGMETDGSVYRESRQAAEQATEFGVDDRSSAGRGQSNSGSGSEAGTLDIFGDADEAVEKMEEESGGWF